MRPLCSVAVSMGGAAGLFVGASLLSFVELLYYFSLRMCRPETTEETQDDGGEAGGKVTCSGLPHTAPACVTPRSPMVLYAFRRRGTQEQHAHHGGARGRGADARPLPQQPGAGHAAARTGPGRQLLLPLLEVGPWPWVGPPTEATLCGRSYLLVQN